ncbi:MAG TPA: hypothetical protein VGO53_10235 [Steroidobacteraceae bacterium]|nr:hypothetical protein [Steroidobacteraceae bacterium]
MPLGRHPAGADGAVGATGDSGAGAGIAVGAAAGDAVGAVSAPYSVVVANANAASAVARVNLMREV